MRGFKEDTKDLEAVANSAASAASLLFAEKRPRPFLDPHIPSNTIHDFQSFSKTTKVVITRQISIQQMFLCREFESKARRRLWDRS